MSDKLGFTFYPKDWWTSDTFFDLDAFERYIFLECMFIMYQNDGIMKTQKTQFENRNRIVVTDEQWKKVTDKFIISDGYFTLLSVNKRLRKAITNRENGSKGGRPKKENNEMEKPKKPKKETQKNPPLESEIENKLNNTNSIDVRKLKFSQSLIPFVQIYGKEIVREFCDYWTEPNKSNTKFKQEVQKTWDTSLRLKRWAKSDFNKNKPTIQKGAIDQSNNKDMFS